MGRAGHRAQCLAHCQDVPKVAAPGEDMVGRGMCSKPACERQPCQLLLSRRRPQLQRGLLLQPGQLPSLDRELPLIH